MKLQALKIAVYSISKHLAGEKLLRNPKGVPSTYVRTIIFSEGIDSVSLDYNYNLKRTTRDFSKTERTEIKEFFCKEIYRFWNKDTKKLESKTNREYHKFINHKREKYLSEKNASFEEIEQRTFDEINKKNIRQKISYTDYSMAFIGSSSQKTEYDKISLAKKECDKFYEKKFKKDREQAKKYNFWSILIHNLKNK